MEPKIRSAGEGDRASWVGLADRLASPVLEAASQGQLRRTMPVETGPLGDPSVREPFSYAEALARLLCGIAPWLELGDEHGSRSERRSRRRLRELALAALDAATDESSPDRILVAGPQTLVEASFLAIAFKRAPTQLWQGLDERQRRRIVDLFLSTRAITPYFNDWLLFPAAIEAWLRSVGDDRWDPVRIDYALRQFEQWYRGDGIYSDGPDLRIDHYNSFGPHPYLLDITDAVASEAKDWERQAQRIRVRAVRYAELQERMIGPDGTYPPWGRSLTYRCAALHGLACVALRRELPDRLPPGAARTAMTSVIRRQFGAGGTFDADGWLRIGLVGHQPELAETYISTGSLYLCSTALLPLGLEPDDPFWTGPEMAGTSARLWSGADLALDVALEKRRS